MNRIFRALAMALAGWLAACGSGEPAPAPALSSLVVSPSQVVGGAVAEGTVSLTSAAGAGGTSVALASSSASASVPALVTVPEGATAARFAVTTAAVETDVEVAVTASLAGVSKVATLAVKAPSAELSSLALAPSSVQGGEPSTGTVTLTRSAPAGGAVVSLSSSDLAAAVPASVTVPAGSTTATFGVTTSVVASERQAVVTGTMGVISRTATLTITPLPPVPELASVSVAPDAVTGGIPSTGTVTLTANAPSGGAVVTLASSRVTATVPASVTVHAGQVSATFAVATTAVAADEQVVITASYAGVDRTATLTVAAPPPVLVGVAISPLRLTGAGSATGTVTLSGAAPAAGMSIQLQSDQTAATVPAWVTVAAGAATASFTVSAAAVDAEVQATVTARLGGASFSAPLTLVPVACGLRAPGAQWLAYSGGPNGGYDIRAMRADGTCQARLTRHADSEFYATWSPSGTIAYMSWRTGLMRIFLLDFTTGEERILDTGDLEATSPAFSPDGTLIAFEGYPPGAQTSSDVYVVPVAGGTPVNVSQGTAYNAGPAWSPDGQTLYFVSNRTGRYDLWKVPAAGGASTQLTTASRILGRPAPTPDGTGVAFARPAAGAAVTEVVILDVSSGPSAGTVRVVTSQLDSEPTFHRTGAQLVVTSQRTGNPELFLLDTATGAVIRQLTQAPTIDGGAAFGPFPPP